METSDSVDPPNGRGVKTLGVGDSMAATEGIKRSYGIRYIATLDCTEVLLHSTVVLVIGGRTRTKDATLVYTGVSTLASLEVGRDTMMSGRRTRSLVLLRSKRAKTTCITLHLGPLIDV